MPTGYTHNIAKGIEFKEFVLQCSRAFGALIDMKEAPMNAPIPDEILPSDWDANKIIEMEKEIQYLKSIEAAKVTELMNVEYQCNLLRYECRIKEALESKEKYEAMLDKVKAWIPPTEDHIKLKNFMIDQIIMTIKYDCNIEYIKPPEKLDTFVWYERKMKKLQDDLIYHRKENDAEIQRCKERTEWIQQLKQSII